MVRLQVTLDAAEADMLARWAAQDLRDPREQLRFVLREALAQRGLLPLDADVPQRPLQPTAKEAQRAQRAQRAQPQPA